MAKLSINALIVLFITEMIGIGLTPSILNQVGTVTGVGGDNFTGAEFTNKHCFFVGSLPLFFCLVVNAQP